MADIAPFPKLAASEPQAKAVIDIGSNSVRMVVYHSLSRVPLPSFNEKYYCELGHEIQETGRLYPEGVERAQHALERFMLMAKRMRVEDITVIATSAIRDAQDGPEFVADFEKRYGMSVDIISGEREASLAAMGVLASFHKPKGLGADLGGGSIEFATIDGAETKDHKSLPLGGLRLADRFGHDKDALHAFVSESLNESKLPRVPVIYAIGGSFRSIAKMTIKESNYPLPILHEYSLSKRQVHQVMELFAKQSVEDIALMPGIPSKRAPTMLAATVLLDTIMEKTGARHVVFSVSGIREGLLYEMLDPQTQHNDPLFASASDLAALAGRHGRYAEELFRWMQPLFPEEKKEASRLRYALCILSELAWTIDPNFRSEWAYNRVIQSAIKGVTHRQRIMLALALYHRYQVKWKQDRPELAMLDERDRLWARCIGMAANLAFHLSGGKANNLHHAALDVDDHAVSLILDEEAKPLRTETVEKRLDGLGEAFSALSNFLI